MTYQHPLVIPLSTCEFPENGCSESHSILSGLTDIPPPPFFSFLSEVEDFGIQDVHKVVFSICEFRENRHRDATLYLGGVNEFLFVFSVCIARFG